MNLSEYKHFLLPTLEDQLKAVVEKARIPEDDSLHRMLSYHMGWSGTGAGVKAQGKRIRPLLLLLSTIANHGKWQLALPAACAVELIHNFSLIHDDIEDNSEFRRGRETLWKRGGVPPALNAGDSMFSLAYIALEDLDPELPANAVPRSYQLLSQACLTLTKGQHLDLSFEKAERVSIAHYFEMIQGKTAALLSCATQLGAVLAGADEETQTTFSNLGFNLGIAFQINDDYLGIWGDEAQTGKSAATDLIARKKSLPILYGLQNSEEFSRRWAHEEITSQNASELANLLASSGALDYTKNQAEHYTGLALQIFQQNSFENDAADTLEELTRQLLYRAA